MEKAFDKKKWKEFRFSLLQEGVYEDYEVIDNSGQEEEIQKFREEFITKIFPQIEQWSKKVEQSEQSADNSIYYIRLKNFIRSLYSVIRQAKMDEMPTYEIPEGVITESKVDLYYDKIIADIRKMTRNLSDDEVFDLHEKLKGFFNKLI